MAKPGADGGAREKDHDRNDEGHGVCSIGQQMESDRRKAKLTSRRDDGLIAHNLWNGEPHFNGGRFIHRFRKGLWIGNGNPERLSLIDRTMDATYQGTSDTRSIQLIFGRMFFTETHRIVERIDNSDLIVVGR